MKVNQNFIPTVTMGGTTVPLGTRYFLLIACVGATALYDTFQKSDGTKYVVPVAKSLRVLAARGFGQGTGTDFYIGKASAPVTNSTIPAGFVNLINLVLLNAGGGISPETSCDFLIATGLYPTFRAIGSNATIVILCEEV